MHQRAAFKAETILVQVEPALAGKEIAHLDEAHEIVRICDAGRFRPAQADQRHKNRRQQCEQDWLEPGACGDRAAGDVGARLGKKGHCRKLIGGESAKKFLAKPRLNRIKK